MLGLVLKNHFIVETRKWKKKEAGLQTPFAEMCRQCHITFIGPSPELIHRMGNKSEARKTMMEAGVPVVPGTKEPVFEAVEGKKIADAMGYPVMIKASSGGGGKGMRTGDKPSGLEV